MTATCPSEDTLLRFGRGELAAPARDRLAEHLDACGVCLALVADATFATRPAVKEPSSVIANAGRLESGVALGRYIILHLQGAGAMAEVYAAFDPELDRRVALKVLRPALVGEDDFETIIAAEARMQAGLHHPNVVSVFDVGSSEGRAFIAMELVEGMTLKRWLQVRSRSCGEIVNVFTRAARGLAAAHEAGIVHRDFKPSNVLIASSESVKVADFGIALRSDRQADAISGTPAYMPPEQWAGAVVGPSSDQFSFCVAMYEALYGKRPTDEIVARQGVGPLAPIAVPDRRGVPARLRRALERGLRTEPSERHRDMKALLVELNRQRRARSRTFAWVAAGALVSAAATWGFSSASEPARATVPSVSAGQLIDRAREAAAAARFLYPPVDDPEGATAFALTLELAAVDPAAADALRAEFAEDLAALGDQFWDRPGGRGFALDFYAAASVFESDTAAGHERATLTPAQRIALRQRAVNRDWTKGELAMGETLAALVARDDDTRRERLASVRERHGPPSATVASELDALLGPATPALDRKAPAKTPLPGTPSAASGDDASRRGAAPAEKPDRKNAKQLIARGVSARKRGDFADAEAFFHRALEANPRSARALSELSRTRFDLNQYAEALAYATRAASRAPRDASMRIQVGDAAMRLFRYDDARAAYVKARELGSKRAQSRLDRLNAKVGKTPR